MYTGPILDSHIHLYAYHQASYPWLAEPGLEALCSDHLPEAYAARARAAGITASVHVEAGRIAEECLDETRWLDELELPSGVADRFVAHVPLADPRAERLLDLQAAVDRVTGIRDIVAWHPDPAKARVTRERPTEDPVWRRNFARLADHGLCFDALMTPYQADEIRRLADDHPTVTIAINHCGSPLDRDRDGMARWLAGLELLAGAPNTVIKVSDPTAYDPDWTQESLSAVIRACVETFGPERAMFGSDDPLSGLFIPLGRWVEVFAAAIADLSDEEQRAVFHDTAARVYRVG